MKLGHPVPGISTEGVFFVVDDQHDVHRRVKEYDADSALVADAGDQMRLGIARFVKDQKWAPGGAWVIAFWAEDDQTGEVICGEADDRILKLQRKYDTHARANSRNDAHRVRMALMMREYRAAAERNEKAREIAVKTVHGWKQKRGIKHKIYVPAGHAD